jgi:hypothetical protein
MTNPPETPRVRTGQGDVKLTREEFERRLKARFYDPAFEHEADAIQQVVDVAWDAYDKYRKSPRTRKAGPGFADPDFDLPIEWLEARARIQEAQRAHDDPHGRSRVLLVCGAARTDETCPGEMSNEQPHRRVRPADPPVQGVRFNSNAALPLALLVLSEPRDGTGERLDE